MKARYAVSLLLASLAGPGLADTFRCNSQLISQGDHVSEVLQKCGEPISEAVVGYKQIRDQWGFFHEVQVMEWTYGPRNGMFHVLRFEGNRLASVDSFRDR